MCDLSNGNGIIFSLKSVVWKNKIHFFMSKVSDRWKLHNDRTVLNFLFIFSHSTGFFK